MVYDVQEILGLLYDQLVTDTFTSREVWRRTLRGFHRIPVKGLPKVR